MMSIPLPHERFTIKTQLAPEEAIDRLIRLCASEFYECETEAHHFTIRRILNYRNSFRPVVEDELLSEEGGWSIQVSMRLSWFELIFSLAWLCFAALLALATLVQILARNSVDDLGKLGALLGLLVFGYALVTISFKFESSKAKCFLCKAFASSEANSVR